MSESKWSELPCDILLLIADRLNKNICICDGFPDIHNLRLRSVCSSWRSSVSLSLFTPPSPPFPIVYQSPSEDEKGNFTLYLSSTYLLQSSSSSPSSSPYWLIRIKNNNNYYYKTRSAKKYHNYRFLLLNPLFDIPLPKRFPKSISLLDFRISCVAASYTLYNDRFGFPGKNIAASTTSSGSVVAIVAILGDNLWFFQTQWTQDSRGRSLRYADVAFRNGQFYAVDMFGKLVSFGGGSDLNAVEIAPLLDDNHSFMRLVVSNGALYLVRCLLYNYSFQLKIYKLNEEEEGKWETVTDLDNHAFFLGYESSYAVSNLDFPALKTNFVYFLNWWFEDTNASEEKLGEFCRHIGVYCLDDGSCGPLANFPEHWPLFSASPTCLKPKKPLNPRKKSRLAHQGAKRGRKL